MFIIYCTCCQLGSFFYCLFVFLGSIIDEDHDNKMIMDKLSNGSGLMFLSASEAEKLRFQLVFSGGCLGLKNQLRTHVVFPV